MSRKSEVAKRLNRLRGEYYWSGEASVGLDDFLEEYFGETGDNDDYSDSEDEQDTPETVPAMETEIVIDDLLADQETDEDDIDDVSVDYQMDDIEEERKVKEYAQNGCTCLQGGSGPCCRMFSESHYQEYRSYCFEMSKGELDMLIIGQISCLTNTSDLTRHSTHHRHKLAERQHAFSQLRHKGLPVCLNTFIFLHTIGIKRYKNLKKHVKEFGVVPRQHGLTGRKPHNAFTLNDTKRIISFIVNYTEKHGVSLPGRIPAFKRDDVLVLPCSTTKKHVWMMYKDSLWLEDQTLPAAKYSLFCETWAKILPHIVISKPLSDLCQVCHENSKYISSSFMCSDEEKQKRYENALEHLRRAKTEREYYRKVCKESYDIVHKKYTENDIFNPPEVGSSPLPLSGPIIAHHSFDFAQQVHYPSDPWQPGPMYFKTPRKCAIFGIHCESIPRQVNYLIDEASVAGKGSNVVVSLLHHYLQHHSLGEQHLHLHADNCVGQNKNNVVIQYLMWRVLVGLNETVTLSFLPVGHTKFAPDWCFGMLKQRYRRTVVGKLADIAEVVEQSSELNYHQLVGMQDGTTIVHTFDWQKFLIPKFNKVQQIKSYHNFRFSNGTLSVSTWSDIEKKELSIRKDHNWQPNPNELPDIIIPRGLDRERQWYLYDQLRHFCPDEESKDATCPLPSLPRPQRSQML